MLGGQFSGSGSATGCGEHEDAMWPHCAYGSNHRSYLPLRAGMRIKGSGFPS